MMASYSKQRKQQPLFPLEDLPDVVLDKVLTNLSPEDLRRFHQVCRAWKNALTSRKRFDDQRIQLVESIRQNKENIGPGDSLESLTPVTRKDIADPVYARSQDKKPGSRLLQAVTNSPCPQDKKVLGKSSGSSILSTPSRFWKQFQAGKKLLPGQELFRCPECSNPVASPVSTTSLRGDSKHRLKSVPKEKSSSSPSLTQDSGFESTEVSSEFHQLSFSDQDELSEEELSLSFVASPEPDEVYFRSTKSLSQQPHSPAFEQGKEKYWLLPRVAAAVGSSHKETSAEETECAQCPECAHRICCKCQESEHSGRPCREITGDSPRTDDSPSLFSSSKKERKLDRRKCSKNILRRIARI